MLRYNKWWYLLIVTGCLIFTGCQQGSAESNRESKMPAQQDELARATFAAGCFWCIQPPFDKQPGVKKTVVGYTGGHTKNPTYEDVGEGTTGHTEAIEVIYNPQEVSYQELLKIFWRNVDPTTPNRQFCDSGTQYRGGIFYHDDQQKDLAFASKKAIEEKYGYKVVLEITAASEFYPAEDYHQDYYKKNPVRYKIYRYGCGRDGRLEELWGGQGDD